MIYELHITVDHTKPDFSLDRWQQFCAEGGIKALDIRLDEFQAKNPRQVMFAAVTEIDGPSSGAYLWRNSWESLVRSEGFDILRSKCEVPLDKSAEFTEPVYHECHVKSLIPADVSGIAVDTIHEEGWLASWNELRPNDDGLEKWYFTLRSYGTRYKDAQREFIDAYAQMAGHHFHTVRMESETVIYDSNPSLDEGWA
jgi:hypothetical protein